MTDAVIEVEQLSKRYSLGSIGSHSLRQDLSSWWSKSVLNRADGLAASPIIPEHSQPQFIWALKDISFTVKQGESFGIIGSNGSGKSTLLKIIARITQPSSGFVRGRGKISSILEIGTGFHHELSGRENIYASGYTLGMNKHEIKTKFDEIVSFSGIEKFIDTPVKRYSSGMYVRLAFAVAAHLEPDILVVDEVLAVGDAEFQKKCMGKMQQVSEKEGRTILFVSHNLQAISNLCEKALWLQHGELKQLGKADEVVNAYISNFKQDGNGDNYDVPDTAPGNDLIRLKSTSIKAQTNSTWNFITVRTPIEMEFEFWCYLNDCNINVNVILTTENGVCVFNLGTGNIKAEKGIFALKVLIPPHLLNNKSYSISLRAIKNNSFVIHDFLNCASFDVEDVREKMSYFGEWPGVIRPQIDSYLYFKEEFSMAVKS